MKYPIWIFLISLTLMSCNRHQQWRINVDAGDFDREATPLTLSFPAKMSTSATWYLQSPASDELIPLQWIDDTTAAFILEAPLAAGEQRTYQLRPGKKQPEERVKLTHDGKDLHIRINDQPVLVYNVVTEFPPAGQPDFYRRSGFIHPLYSPGGQVLTDGFPVGHTHQHGLFYALVNTTYKGDFTDFWNQHKETGTVGFVGVEDTLSGPVFAQMATQQVHLSRQHGPVLQEDWVVRVYNFSDYFVLDFTSTLHGPKQDTLFVNKYHYGGLGLRGSAEWNAVDSAHYTNPMQVMTSEGKTGEAANHSRPGWIAAYGQVENQTSTVTVIDHPANFRHPQPVRVHPSMPYFCMAPMVVDSFLITPGMQYQSAYRIITSTGQPEEERINQFWSDYVHPPKVEVRKGKNLP